MRVAEMKRASTFSGRAACAQTQSHYLLLRRGVVPHDTTGDAGVNCSGFAMLRLRQCPTSFTPEHASCEAGRERSDTSRSPLRRLPLVVPFGVNPQGTGALFVIAPKRAKAKRVASAQEPNVTAFDSSRDPCRGDLRAWRCPVVCRAPSCRRQCQRAVLRAPSPSKS